MRLLEMAPRERVQKRHLAGRAMFITAILYPPLAGGSVERAQLTQNGASNDVLVVVYIEW